MIDSTAEAALVSIMPYNAPVSQIADTLARIGRLDELAATGAFPNFDADLVAPILDEANKLARDVLAPLNPVGHKAGAKLTDTGVIPTPGFSDAYRQFVEGGWMSLAFPEQFGGQGLPKPLALAVFEMIHGANMAFGLCPLLSFGAIEALLAHGSPELQQTYLPKLISGEWTGAMNLTEPQAGSDVGALVTRAVPNADGSYAITGQKIFITWGDHDMTPNIIQLVLARLPDAPPGSKGISLFIAPKFFVNADGSLGERNTFKCIGLEHKMGIHGSPTCVMEYTGAKGWLVGEPNKGLAAMFTMMNSARLNVGLEGVAVGEAALQAGVAYAKERRQGAAPGIKGAAPIIRHPDVQRMLLTMAANVQAARAICYACGSAADLAEHHPDEATRKTAKAREDLLTPLAKAWSTDRAIDITNLGVQIHGGMGFMSETAAAQYYLDARITPIYEGTNGIQAMDLVGRKLSMDNGAAMKAMIAEIREGAREITLTNEAGFHALAASLNTATDALSDATDYMIAEMNRTREKALAAATSYLRLAGDVVGGYFLVRSAFTAREAADATQAFHLASYFAGDTLARAPGAATALREGADTVYAAAASFWAEA
jgi:alkylation response protein AidB-like acyl-CoA dehydrogenase